ncbi:hypothetical protein JHW43_004277 [Diplocarpon mali]|nr:hypothetical protein JHW43_004277 [Diplocarpon mali]
MVPPDVVLPLAMGSSSRRAENSTPPPSRLRHDFCPQQNGFRLHDSLASRESSAGVNRTRRRSQLHPSSPSPLPLGGVAIRLKLEKKTRRGGLPPSLAERIALLAIAGQRSCGVAMPGVRLHILDSTGSFVGSAGFSDILPRAAGCRLGALPRSVGS